MVNVDYQERRVCQVFQECQVNQDRPEMLAKKDHLVLQDKLENPALWVYRGYQVSPESGATMGNR